MGKNEPFFVRQSSVWLQPLAWPQLCRSNRTLTLNLTLTLIKSENCEVIKESFIMRRIDQVDI